MVFHSLSYKKYNKKNKMLKTIDMNQIIKIQKITHNDLIIYLNVIDQKMAQRILTHIGFSLIV